MVSRPPRKSSIVESQDKPQGEPLNSVDFSVDDKGRKNSVATLHRKSSRDLEAGEQKEISDEESFTEDLKIKVNQVLSKEMRRLGVAYAINVNKVGGVSYHINFGSVPKRVTSAIPFDLA